MTTTTSESKDPRVERILTAAEQHGQNDDPDHEVGDLQDVLRAAWSLMSTEQRNQLMAAAETVNVLQAGDDFIEVAELRGCLMGDEGLRRVLIEVTRDGGDAAPRITSMKVFDAGQDEIDWQAGGLDVEELDQLALRLDEELLQAMPPQSVTPAWVSTIDWNLESDVLTHSVQIEGIDRKIQTLRWRNASDALDRHLLPERGDGWGEERIVVMELAPTAGADLPRLAMPRWAELTLNTAGTRVRSGNEQEWVSDVAMHGYVGYEYAPDIELVQKLATESLDDVVEGICGPLRVTGGSDREQRTRQALIEVFTVPQSREALEAVADAWGDEMLASLPEPDEDEPEAAGQEAPSL